MRVRLSSVPLGGRKSLIQLVEKGRTRTRREDAEDQQLTLSFPSPPAQKLPRQANDEPLFTALLAHWQTNDAEALVPLLLAAVTAIPIRR